MGVKCENHRKGGVRKEWEAGQSAARCPGPSAGCRLSPRCLWPQVWGGLCRGVRRECSQRLGVGERGGREAGLGADCALALAMAGE